ncbi:hypothetical protein [Gloeocapsopsis sp. IPPAS B-1203]|uniref:hypothetical protein n=1 Tax=Gloeocapsopsis sp. IPPAS B-1203 TaxID=2049454 RepID=UPI0025A25729|nr:hypothetical protein [Gloeocapsopsis sp. IPPAS B-1203]
MNSASEAIDTALKIAIAYHWIHDEASCQRLIGRKHAYHSVNFGAVGGIGANRQFFLIFTTELLRKNISTNYFAL